MTWFFGIVAALVVLDGLRLRGRFLSLPRLTGAEGPVEADQPGVVAFTGPGVELDSATAASARELLEREGLEAVDLLPANARVADAMGLMAFVDPKTYRKSPLARGRSATAALIATPELAQRAELAPDSYPTGDAVAVFRAAARAKIYAPRAVDVALAPGMSAPALSPADRLGLIQAVFRRSTPAFLVLQLLMLLVIAAGAAWPGAWPAGLVALGAFHLQPLIATAGTGMRPRDLWPMVLFRLPLELWNWLRTATAPSRPAAEDPVEVRRPGYAELLARNPDRLFEPRSEVCPLCGSHSLSVRLRTTDLLQHKPGQFTIERCGDCGHMFQNPRLSLEGLDFYYKDFYDGLGENGADFFFGAMGGMYRKRANMVAEVDQSPGRWLDVGGGHGHFCVVAKDDFPDTEFEALDLSDSVDEAQRRGWVEDGHRGLFPDVAPTMAGHYDVVSMYHYLEHTRDPHAEIAAAYQALRGDGLLIIELPDPDSPMGRVLGRYWIPWFQPQHQHFVSVANLDKLLREHGFEPLEWHRSEAHQKNDLFGAVSLWLASLAPVGDMPWRPPLTALGRLRRRLVWTIGLPLVGLAQVGDFLLSPFLKATTSTNTYRVLARKSGASASGVIDAAA